MDIGAGIICCHVPLWIVEVVILAIIARVDGNTPPQWVDYDSRLFVSEDKDVGDVITTLHGRDGDGDSLSFNVQGAGGVVLVLKASNNSASVVLGTMLDREAVDRYNFTFTLSDGVNDPIRRYCTLYVLDANDNAPRFLKEVYQASVSEDTARGREVLRVSAHDPDLSHEGLVTYSEDPEGSWSDFTVDWVSGVIRVNRDLDMGKKSAYDLSVKAVDGGDLTGTAQVQIQVTAPSANSSNNDLHCYNCDKTKDCAMEQLSYSTTSRCKPNQLCFVEAIQRNNEYQYSRGCREVDSCGERDKEICSTENNVKNCTMCCSSRICNGNRMKEDKLQEARQLLAQTASGKGNGLQSNEIRCVTLFLVLELMLLEIRSFM